MVDHFKIPHMFSKIYIPWDLLCLISTFILISATNVEII